MTITTKVAAAGLLALALVGSAIAPAAAQRICMNPAPARSLIDTTTENQDALNRIAALGNRCVTSRVTGKDLTRDEVLQFLSTNPDQRDVDYNDIARQLNMN